MKTTTNRRIQRATNCLKILYGYYLFKKTD